MRPVGSWPKEEVLQDRAGNRWHFVYLYGGTSQRLFFWNQSKTATGIAVFPQGRTVSYTRIRDLMKKLVADQALRQKYQQDLEFPLNKHYQIVQE